MTAQEAIEILRNAAWLGTDADRDKTEEAIGVALKALETKMWHLAEPTEKDIDRIQNAINHIKSSVDIDPWAMRVAVDAMQEKIEHFADISKMDDIRDDTKKMADLIDRAKAQTAIMLEAKRYVISAEAQAEGHVLWSAETIDLESALDALRRVPSAQQGRTQGMIYAQGGKI